MIVRSKRIREKPHRVTVIAGVSLPYLSKGFRNTFDDAILIANYPEMSSVYKARRRQSIGDRRSGQMATTLAPGLGESGPQIW